MRVTCVTRPGVGLRGEPGPPIRTRACVRALQLQDPPNRLPTRLLDTNTSSGHRLQHQTGSLRAYRSRTGTYTILRLSVPPPFPALPPSFLLRRSPHLRLSLLRASSLFILSLSLPPCPSLPHASPRARQHDTTGICAIIKPRLLPRLHTHRPGGASQWTAGKTIGIS